MATSKADHTVVGTKLGLRLGADVLAAGTAAATISPLVCLIDRFVGNFWSILAFVPFMSADKK